VSRAAFLPDDDYFAVEGPRTDIRLLPRAPSPLLLEPVPKVSGVVVSTHCPVCGRPRHQADTRDDQIVSVGPECHKLILAAGEVGYQPAGGGPRLYPLKRVTGHACSCAIHRGNSCSLLPGCLQDGRS
jgi:hypothetical protein